MSLHEEIIYKYHLLLKYNWIACLKYYKNEIYDFLAGSFTVRAISINYWITNLRIFSKADSDLRLVQYI